MGLHLSPHKEKEKGKEKGERGGGKERGGGGERGRGGTEKQLKQLLNGGPWSELGQAAHSQERGWVTHGKHPHTNKSSEETG